MPLPLQRENVDTIIETERLILRHFRENYWDVFFNYFSDPLVQEGILSYQSGEEHIQRHFANGLMSAELENRSGYIPAIVMKENNLMIGSCTISGLLSRGSQTRIGWHLGSAFNGKGYATETAAALLQLGFERHNVDLIYSECFADNIASRRAIEKNGFTLCKSNFFQRWFRGVNYGEQRPIVRYQIKKKEWLANQITFTP